MTGNTKIPVLKNIVQAGKRPPIRKASAIPPERASTTPATFTKTGNPHPADTNELENLSITGKVIPQNGSPNIRDQALYKRAEILLSIVEEELGIHLTQRRKKLLDALAEQLRS